jgi:hypothetical protein
MKNLLKTAAVALVIAIAAISCDPAKTTTTGAVDSLKKDSTIKVDTTKEDTTTTSRIVKKDSVRK